MEETTEIVEFLQIRIGMECRTMLIMKAVINPSTTLKLPPKSIES